jgi:hypothetical protein
MAIETHDELTELLKGKTINGTSDSGGEKKITFSDGLKLTAKAAPGNSNSASTGGAVKAVRLGSEPATLYLDLEGDSTVEIPLAGAGSSVEVRDDDDKVKFEN